MSFYLLLLLERSDPSHTVQCGETERLLSQTHKVSIPIRQTMRFCGLDGLTTMVHHLSGKELGDQAYSASRVFTPIETAHNFPIRGCLRLVVISIANYCPTQIWPITLWEVGLGLWSKVVDLVHHRNVDGRWPRWYLLNGAFRQRRSRVFNLVILRTLQKLLL